MQDASPDPDHPAADSYEALAGPLLLYARQWLDGTDAEDVVQEAFVRLLDARRKRRGPSEVRPWMFRVVRNAALSWRRSAKRRRARERQGRGASSAWFDGRSEDLVDGAVVQRAMAELPDQVREVLVLRSWGGLTLEQVATVTGLSVPSAFRRHRAALEALRNSLRQERSCHAIPSPSSQIRSTRAHS